MLNLIKKILGSDSGRIQTSESDLLTVHIALTVLLLQAAYAGVTYNHMLRPNAPATGVEIAVYEAIPKPGKARVNQHAVLLEPSGSELTVKEIYFYENGGSTTWNDPEGGTLRFYLPEAAAGKATVMAQAPQGMPIRRPADPAGKPEVFKVDFPIKPGPLTA